MKFVHLHTHSHYSLLDGMSKVNSLVKKAKEHGMKAMAITDHGTLYGAVEFYKEAKANDIKPILGVEAYVAPGDHKEKTGGMSEDRYFHLVLLVKDKTGWENLLQLVTKSYLDGFYYKPRMDKELLKQHHEGLIALSGCLSGEVARTLLKGDYAKAKSIALEYQEIFGKGNYYIEIQRHKNIPDAEKVYPELIKLAKEINIPLVGTSDSHYLEEDDRGTHDILLCLQTGKRITDENKMSLEDDFSFASEDKMIELFEDAPEAVANTIEIANKCNFELELGKILLPKFETPDGKLSKDYLRELVDQKIKTRYPNPSNEVKERVKFELSIIEKMGFPDYFLIVQDFINWAKERGIAVGPGRGSAAGSIVSYILGITDLDPLLYGLLFERFLNPGRNEMPDIDIDIADVRRDEVFGYLQEKYGEDHVAHIITFGTMAARAAIRDVGRVLDIELPFCDKLAKLVPFQHTLDKALKSVPEFKSLYENDDRAKQIIDSAKRLEGVARHASVHACGIIVSSDPLVKRVPLQYSPQKDNAIVTQFEMYSVESLGLLKIDLLGLKNLTIIEDAIKIIKERLGEDIDISKVSLDDKKAFELLQAANTVGIFQLECLTGDTRISNTTIKKLYQNQNSKKTLRSVYVDSGKIHNNKIKTIVQSGKKKVFRVTTENGRMIKASGDHMFMTKEGWKKLKDMRNNKDLLLYKPKSKHVILHQCTDCGALREIFSENIEKHRGFCYSCSAKHFSNPSKKKSRIAISKGGKRFLDAGGKPWNYSLTKDTNPILAETGKKISKSLTGITLEMRYGKRRADAMKKQASEKFSGDRNPMFGKKAPHRKGGFREDIGHYVRSNWEADFARILNLYNVEYEYEPRTFELVRSDGERLSYTPDFFTPQTNTYYEIKGWLHELDIEKMNLFRKQYPQHKFVLINKTKFAELALQHKNLVKWECPVVPDQLSFTRIHSIEELDEEMTYDILMESPGNNFIANSFVVHNSGGMRRYLKDLRPTELEDIIAMVALYRPGPMELIPSYIARKYGKEDVTYLHPELKPILENTYGIGIYQEQMMRIASDLAGYTLSEADTLRKAIGKKIKKLLDKQEEKLTKALVGRGMDQRTAQAIWSLFPPFARYGFNRCLTGDTLISDPKTGSLTSVKDLYNEKTIQQTLSLDEGDQKIYSNKIEKIIDNGKKPTFELTTKSGRTIKATANHPFLTADGWKILKDIKPKEKIAAPRILPEPTTPSSEKLFKLSVLGYLIAEGNLCHPHSFYFYSKDSDELNDYITSLEKFDNTISRVDKSKSTASVYAKRKNRDFPSEAVEWISSLGLRNKKATEKFLPDFVFGLRNKDLAVVLAKLFQGDGCISTKREDPEIYLATSSKKLARQFQHLLLRFGILSVIHAKKFKYRGSIKKGFTITITRYDNIFKFLEALAPHFVSQKKKVAEQVLKNHPVINGSIKPWAARGSKDVVPINLALPVIRQVVMATGESFKNTALRNGFAPRLLWKNSKKNGFLRETLDFIGTQLNSSELNKLANSDIYWDEIAAINPSGEEVTYDLSMEKDHNFIANDIFVHNSHAASYAMISYRTAYLKANYPVAFMTALFNADSGDVERISFLIDESKRMKIEVLPPDINKSDIRFIPEGNNIRFGLSAVKNVGHNIVAAIIEERSRGGEFENFATFVSRVKHKDLNKKSLESLTKCGALDIFKLDRNTILNNLDTVTKFAQAARKKELDNQSSLFGDQFSSSASKAALEFEPATPATSEERLSWEKDLLGLYVSENPLDLAKTKIEAVKPNPIKEVLEERSDVRPYRIAGMICTVKSIITKTGKPMAFIKLEDKSGSIEIVAFSDVYAEHKDIWQEGKIICLTGRLSFRNGQTSMICGSVKEL